MARPIVRLKLAIVAARRRRYGYAALRVLRRGLGRAMVAHVERSAGDRPYASELEEIYRVYGRALADLRRRFPTVDLSDPRSAP